MMSNTRTFVVDLGGAEGFGDFVAAFNQGFCEPVGGHWSGNSWDAFHDYLSWPEEEQFVLVFRQWQSGRALAASQKAMVEQILKDNPHVQVAYE